MRNLFHVPICALAFVTIASCSTASPTAPSDAGAIDLSDATNEPDTTVPEPKDATPVNDATLDAVADAGADPCPIAAPGDGGARANFESELVDGIWAFGDGTLFTYVRFNYTGGLQGSADYLPATTPGYFPCKAGIGLSTANVSDGSAILQLPSGCNNEGHRFEFLCVAPGGASHPAANLQATIRDNPPGNVLPSKIIKGYRYPKTHCSADMKTCGAL